MLLPYDIFTNIIPFSDMTTIFNLYHTDRKLRKLCLNDKFGKVLIETSNNKYFNLDAKSELSDKFPNDITNTEMFNKLQLKLAISLIEKLIIIEIYSIKASLNDIESDQINTDNKILFSGFTKGKSTLIMLLRKLNLKIDCYCENVFVRNRDQLYNLMSGKTMEFRYIFKSNNPSIEIKFNNNFNLKEKTRDLLLNDQNVLSSLLNFLLDGYRKLCF
jgi:hypothetical protein